VPELQKTTVKLADAQLVVAREHGFDSWPKFSAHLRTLQDGPPDAFQERIRAGEAELTVEMSGRRNARAPCDRSLPSSIASRSALCSRT
jgi:hypothetical protein